MEDIACPRCKTTKYRNPSLKLLVNICGHALCDNCVELLFVKGSANCPECQVTLRRGGFRVQMFEDAGVEKEVDIRKRVLRDFNKREEDFETLREFNDYLEYVEDIVYNLTNDLDLEETKKKIEQYRKENRMLIVRNKGKLSKDEEYLEELIELEQQETEARRQQLHKEEVHEKRSKTKNKEALIDELMFSDAPASEILATHSAQLQREAAEISSNDAAATAAAASRIQPTKFSSGIRLWGKTTDGFLPVPKVDEAPPYKYEEMSRDLWGPPVPGYDQLESRGYLNNTKATSDQERASGFVSNMACFRALEEALCGLYYGTSPSCSSGAASNQPQPMEMS